MILAKKLCAGLDVTAKARLNMQAIPSADEDLEEKVCIPVIGALLSGKKSDGNTALKT